MLMQGMSSCMLYNGDYMAPAGILLMTCITEIGTFLGVGKYEGGIWRVFMCLSESICLTMKNQF